MANEKIKIDALVDHLFRYESGRLIAVLTRIFGSENMELAEDVVQDALVEAIKHWSYDGIPVNPSAWLFSVAKNKALNILKREKYKREYSEEAAHLHQSEHMADSSPDNLFSEQEIRDDQLRMIFMCCHPSISPDSQIAFTLKTLCGFSIPEIAKAFLSNNETINKRLVRARRTIRDQSIAFELPKGHELESRLHTVLESIYLLFNEGYSAYEGDKAIREDLCAEAIRLVVIIAAHPSIMQKSSVYALLSLMLLNVSRFEARQDSDGGLIELANQNRTLWNQEKIREGIKYLHKSTGYGTVSRYHILAAISAHHCTAPDSNTTDWKSILSLYDNLIQIDNSPVVILNRAVAVSKIFGAEQAVIELEKLKDDSLLKNYPHYNSTLGELFIIQKKPAIALRYLEKALELTKNRAEITFLQCKINRCKKKI